MGFFGKKPLLFWGTPENIGAWTAVNAAVISAANDPFGAASGLAKLIDDQANQANPGYAEKAVTGLPTGVSSHVSYHMVRRGPTAQATGILWWRDTTANATRRVLRINWSTNTVTSLSGDASLDLCLVAVDPAGNTWLLIRMNTTGIVPANTNVLRFLPAAATETDGTLIGSAVLHRQPFVILPFPISKPRANRSPKPGYDTVRAASIEDVWDAGLDYWFRGEAHWLPAEEDAGNGAYPATGYNGDHSYVAIDPGIGKFLEYAWGGSAVGKNTIRFVPDRADLAQFFDAYLQKPQSEEEISLESDGSRWFEFLLRSSTDVPFKGY